MSDPQLGRIRVAVLALGLGTFSMLYFTQSLLPELSRRYDVGPATASLAQSAATLALAASVLPLTAWSARRDRSRVLVSCLAVAGVLGLASAAAPNFAVLVVLRAMQGAAIGGIPAVATAYLADRLPPRGLAATVGLFVAGNGLGGMSGRVLSGSLVDLGGWPLAAAGAGAFGLAAAAVTAALLPHGEQSRTRPAALSLREGLGQVVADPVLRRLMVYGTALMATFVSVYNYLGYRLADPPYSLTAGQVGLVFLLYLAGTASSVSAGWVDRRGSRPAVVTATAVLAMLGVAITAAGPLPVVLLGVGVLTAALFLGHTLTTTWIADRSRRLGGQGTAAYTLFFYLGSSVGGSAGGLLFAPFGWPGLLAYGGVLLTVAIAVVPRGTT